MTAPMIDPLASMINAQLEVLFERHNDKAGELTGEIERLERQASNLVTTYNPTLERYEIRGMMGPDE